MLSSPVVQEDSTPRKEKFMRIALFLALPFVCISPITAQLQPPEPVVIDLAERTMPFPHFWEQAFRLRPGHPDASRVLSQRSSRSEESDRFSLCTIPRHFP